MKTRREQMTAGGLDGYSNFAGDDSDYADWFGILGRSRDSGTLERSNFDVGLEMLGGESETVIVCRYGHWAVGWIEEVYVKPGSPAEAIAREIEEAIADYPVLNEDHHSELEHDEAMEVWSNCFDTKDRIEYMRNRTDQFDFLSLGDMLRTARGQYFGGYASELVD